MIHGCWCQKLTVKTSAISMTITRRYHRSKSEIFMNFSNIYTFDYFNQHFEKMRNYKLKLKFDSFRPKSRTFTIWICDGIGPDGLPCGYEAPKDRTIRHFAAKHLKIKTSQQPKISILLRDYDIRITRGITYQNFRKTAGSYFCQ